VSQERESKLISFTAPRWIAYPLLLAIPVVCIYAGIGLGNAGVASHLMVTSHNGTPIENWTLSLITVCIALFMYGAWARAHRSFRFRPSTLLLVIAYIAAIFLFGAWGLLGSFVLSAFSLLAIAFRRRINNPPLT
jgi:hypothetical protein